MTSPRADTDVRSVTTEGGIGESVIRSDAIPKTTGDFAFSSDLWAEGMLWGATLRSPHVRARIVSIDYSEALTTPGVFAILTHEDVPGRKTYGLEIPDQPVLAFDEVRYAGEPVALVAADHPAIARRAAERIRVTYEELPTVTDPEAALLPDAPDLRPEGNVLRHIPIRHGDQDATADVVVSGDYSTQMQDQAFLGPESGLAVPSDDGGVEIYAATQWLHVDREQIAHSLGLPEEMVRLTLAGVGGSFGGREDLSMQIHAAILALHTGRPTKMVYGRDESFVGHVHRHPARMHYEHGATRDGKLVYVKARIVLDGGAYASSSPAVVANAACFAAGPYDVPSSTIDAYVVYTDNPPCGAMRGFGSNQVCFAYESQMDKLAEALDMDPVDLRLRNAMSEGSAIVTGQVIEGPVAAPTLLRQVREMPLPDATPPVPSTLPGGFGNSTHGEGVVRGIGYALGFKNICYSEGFDDYGTARVRLSASDGRVLAQVHTAAVEVGQGLTTVLAQIARTELGLEDVAVLPADTAVGSAGSSSASRQTWMAGGSVKAACDTVRETLRRRISSQLGRDPGPISLEGGKVLGAGQEILMPLADLLAEDVEETAVYRHHPTSAIDPETGQGDAHVSFAFAAHRAVVDVDTELGLVRVVEVSTAQDVGKAINPVAIEGQIEGGIAQGMGYAVMEEMKLKDGRIMNPSFTDYIIPTILDVPRVNSRILELADPRGPYGLRGVGEMPTISSSPAIVAAIRAATGRALESLPVKPDDIVGLGDAAS